MNTSHIPIPVARGKGAELIAQYMKAIARGDDERAIELQKLILMYLACCEEIVLHAPEDVIEQAIGNVNQAIKQKYKINGSAVTFDAASSISAAAPLPSAKDMEVTRKHFFNMNRRLTPLSPESDKKMRTLFKSSLTRFGNKLAKKDILKDPFAIGKAIQKLDFILGEIIGPKTEEDSDGPLLGMIDSYISLNNKLIHEMETTYPNKGQKKKLTDVGFTQSIPSVLPPMPKDVS